MNKRILSLGLISAVAFGLVSCEKVEFQQESSTIGDNFGFIAEISEESRTTNNNSYTTAWLNDDEMAVFYYSSYTTKQYTFKYNNGIFTPISSDGISENEKTWVGVYPKTNSVSLSGTNGSTIKVTLTVPDTFRQAGNNSMSHLAGEDGLPMYGSVTGKLAVTPKMPMKQMAAVIKFNITNAYADAVTISRIEFEAADDNLVGQFTGTLSSDEVSSWSAGTGAAKKVTLNVQDGLPVANGSAAAFYVGTAPFSHSGGHNYTLTVYGTDSEGRELKATKTASLAMTLASAKVKTIKYTFPADATPIVKKTYTKLTSNESLENGTYLIVNLAENRALTSTGAKDVTVVESYNNVISSSELADCEFVINAVSGGYTIKQANGDNYLARDDKATGNDANYIKYTSSPFTFAKITKSTDLFCFQASDQDSEYLYYNSKGYFKIGGSGNPTPNPPTTNPDSGVYLYKYDDPRKSQNISFSKASPSIDFAITQTFTQTVSDAQTSVNYAITESSPEGIATIDATSGQVTVTGDGTVVVTATAAATAEYQGATASYTLTITDSSKKYYKKVSIDNLSDLTSGQYLLYSASNKYLFDATHSTSYRKSQDTPTENKIAQSTDLDKLLVTFEEASSGMYYVKTSEGYLGRSSSIIFDEKPSTEFTISLSDGQISLSTKGSSTYYLCYTSNYISSGFSYSSSSSAVNFDLYLLDGSKKLSRNLAFAEKSVSKQISDGDFTIALIGNTSSTTVNYTSSEKTVATVSDAGLIHIVGRGTTVISADTDEDETYRAGHAEYTLTVIDPSYVPCYVLVTSEPESWDGTYLIVSAASGNAYAFDYSTAGTYNYASGKDVSISDGKIYSNATIDACAVTVSKYGDSHGSETAYAAYDIKVANGKYLYRYSDKIIQDSSEQGSGSNKRQNQHTLVYNNGVRMMFSGNQSSSNKYYFHFADNKFTYEDTKNATDDSKYRVYFFKLHI